MIKKFFDKKIKIPVILCIVLVIFFSVLLTGLMLLIQPNGFWDLKLIFDKTEGLFFILNFIPILFCSLFLFFVTNNLILSLLIISFLGIGGSLINRYKIILRQNHFSPWDFKLSTEVFEIVKNTDIKIIIGVILCVLLIFLIGFLVMKKFKTKKINSYFRIISLTIIVVSILLINKRIYSNQEIYNSLYVQGNFYNEVERVESRGFLYNFIFEGNNNSFKKFNDYKINNIKSLEENYPTEDYNNFDENVKPHIIMIMSEAFSEISENEIIDFNGYEDPLKFYKKMKEESIYGNIVVPNFGGGTADTEFDVLTGANTRNFRGLPYAFKLIGKEILGFTNTLNNLGYENTFIHPGHSWFYGRQNIYPLLGFSKFIDITEFPEDQYKGMYVTDTATFDRLIIEFENHLKNKKETPFFEFTVTIQNHGPYTYKYELDQNFNSTKDLSEIDIKTLSNYFDGLKDGDKELERLYNYLNKINEPVMVVFFGDHLPAITPEFYNLINKEDSDINKSTDIFQTPFLIWQNKTYKKISDFENQKIENEKIISSNYLGDLVLNLLDFDKTDSFVQYSLEMMEKYPVVLENQYFDKDYKIYENPEDSNEDLKKYKNWQYYKIIDER